MTITPDRDVFFPAGSLLEDHLGMENLAFIRTVSQDAAMIHSGQSFPFSPGALVHRLANNEPLDLECRESLREPSGVRVSGIQANIGWLVQRPGARERQIDYPKHIWRHTYA